MTDMSKGRFVSDGNARVGKVVRLSVAEGGYEGARSNDMETVIHVGSTALVLVHVLANAVRDLLTGRDGCDDDEEQQGSVKIRVAASHVENTM